MIQRIIHCCELMEYYLNIHLEQGDGEDIFKCPDSVILYDEIFDEYGLIIHDGGRSKYSIKYCPWCGKKLPKSKRINWFEELEKLGFDDPFCTFEELPQEYKTCAWRLRWKVKNNTD